MGFSLVLSLDGILQARILEWLAIPLLQGTFLIHQRGGRDGLPTPDAAAATRTAVSSRRACLGQCFSYSVPNTFPQSTESLVHCDSCMPAQSMWEIVSTARPAWPPPSLGPG